MRSAKRTRSSAPRPPPAPSHNVATPSTVAGTSTTANADAIPAALPSMRVRMGTPMAASWRSVPVSRSPANAGKASITMSSGTSSCSTAAAVHSPKRATLGRSMAGRRVNSFCLCASSHVVTPV